MPLGEATLKVEYNGRLYHGRGISTDIVKSSVNAYINAVNLSIPSYGARTTGGRIIWV